MKDIVKVFASYAAAGAGMVIGFVAGERVSRKIFKKRSAEGTTEEK